MRTRLLYALTIVISLLTLVMAGGASYDWH
jgi:hypothetical protein